MTLLATLPLLLAAAPPSPMPPAPSCAGDLLRVGPTQAFNSIQGAVNAADPGDVLLVDSGLYPGDVDISETIAVVANGGSAVLLGHLSITGLTGDGALLISNLTIRPTTPSPTPGGCEVRPAVTILNCRAGIRFQGGGIEGATGDGFCGTTEGPGGTALDVERAFDVSLSGCFVRGGVSEPSAQPGATGSGGLGLRVGPYATVEVEGGNNVGGQGLSGFGDGSTGGTAIRVEPNGRAFLLGTSLQGGRGGNAVGGLGGPGGDALEVLAGGIANLQGTARFGGPGGGGSLGSGENGASLSGAGLTASIPGPAVRLDTPTLNLAGSPGSAIVTGLSSATPFTPLTSQASGWRYAPALGRPLHILLSSPTTVTQPTVTSDPSGTTLLPLVGTALNIGESARVVWIQVAANTVAGTRFSSIRGYLLLSQLP